MIIKIDINKCEHLKDMSYYNNNYYRLPFEIDGCSIVYEKCDEEYSDYMYFLGNEEDGEFGVTRAKEHYSADNDNEECLDMIIFDSRLKHVWYT